MKSIFNRGLIAVVLFSFVCASSISAQVKITLNPEKGKQYEFRYEINQQMTMLMQDQEMPMENKMLFVLEMTVADKTTDSITLSYLFKRMDFSFSNPMMGETSYSTDQEAPTSEFTRDLAVSAKSLIGKSFQATMTPDGEVIKIEGVQEWLANSPSNPMTEQLLQQFSDESLANMSRQNFNYYPKEAVKVGDTWNCDLNLNIGMSAVNSVCTLKSVSDKTAVIDLVSQVKIDSLPMAEANLSGTQTGTIIVDLKTGIPVSQDIVINVEGKLSAPDVDMNIKMTTQGKSTTKEL